MLTLLSQKKKSETLFPRGEMCSIFLTSFFFVSFTVVVIIIKKRKFKECKKKKKATHRMSKQLFELLKTIKKTETFPFLIRVRIFEKRMNVEGGKSHKYSRDNLVKRFMILNSLSYLKNRGVGTNEQTKLFDSSLMDVRGLQYLIMSCFLGVRYPWGLYNLWMI